MADDPTSNSQEDAFAASAPSRRRRFYFDIRDGEYVQKDNDGVLLDGMEAAKAQAMMTLPDMARDEIPHGGHREYAIEVKDENGRLLFTVRLSLAFETA